MTLPLTAESRLARVLALAVALLLPLQALAWNAAGHRLVARIAWEQLQPPARAQVVLLLQQHPDYARWCARATDDDDGRTAFVEASTWPDEIRQDRRFFSADVDPPTPALPGFPDMERHQDWHFVNRPLAATRAVAELGGQLPTQLARLTMVLAAPETTIEERAYALPWLIHLVGDAHQPLHTSIRLAADGRRDEHGHEQHVLNPFAPRRKNSTLHAFWDDLPGPSSLRGERLEQASRELTAAYPRPRRLRTSADWIEESWRIARDDAYPPSLDSVPTISADFYARSRRIAGYRLAELLNRALAWPPRQARQR